MNQTGDRILQNTETNNEASWSENEKIVNQALRKAMSCDNPAAFGAAYGRTEDKEELLRNAEIEMYRMKGESRNSNKE